MKRRDVLRLAAAAAAGAGCATTPENVRDERERERELLQYLCPPDGFAAPFFEPSPKAKPFVAELFVPPVKQPVPALDPPPDPKAHQQYEKYLPKKFYETREMELQWQYHPHPPYDKGSYSWGFDGITPGPTFLARYGEPVLVRRYNNLPPVGQSRVTWALPSTTTHLHNGHTASESDGNPQDWIDPGEFWDYHYGNFPSGGVEYNWGADHHINGGTAQADILGIFGREGLDMAVRWGTPALDSFAARAFQMYRNYDGSGGKFGDTSVSATAPNADEVSAFASIRQADGALTVMLVAKTLSGDTPATVSLANFGVGGPVQRWQLDSTKTITRRTDLTAAGASVALTLPAQSVTLLVIPAAPVPPAPAITATAASAFHVGLSWSAIPGALSYEVQRSFNGSAFALLTTTGATTASDNALSANTTYLYRVRGVLANGATAFSTIDPATTIVFTDSPLVAGTRIKAVHFAELRTAVNAMRVSAGLAAQTFTDPVLSSAVRIKAVHRTEIRAALDAARAQLGLPALVYTGGTTIKTAHVTEVRNGVR